MKRIRVSILSIILLAVVIGGEGRLYASCAITVYFSPGSRCTDAVVNEIANARSSILVQTYGFSTPPIAKALLEAQKRDVKA